MKLKYLGKEFHKVILSPAANRFVSVTLQAIDHEFLEKIMVLLHGIETPTSEGPPKLLNGKYRRVVGQVIQFEIVDRSKICLKMAMVIHFDEAGSLWIDEIRL